MSASGTLMGRKCDEVIAEAAYQKVVLVLTCRAEERWETHKSRLLDIAQARRALVVAYPNDAVASSLDLARGEQIGVAFRHHSRKCLFSTTILGKRFPRRSRLRASGTKALLLDWPTQIEQLQRRVYHRVQIPTRAPIDVRFWRGGVKSADPIPPTDTPLTIGCLLDLSVGGTRVEVRPADDPCLEVNELVGMAFRVEPGQAEFVLEGCFRHVQTENNGQLSLGFQFIGLEVSSESPSPLIRLARAVSRLQRDSS